MFLTVMTYPVDTTWPNGRNGTLYLDRGELYENYPITFYFTMSLVGWMEFLFARVLGSMIWPPSVVMLSESVAALPAVQAGMPRLEWQVLAAAAWLVLLPVVLAVYALRDQLPDMLSLFQLPSMRARGRRSRGALENA